MIFYIHVHISDSLYIKLLPEKSWESCPKTEETMRVLMLIPSTLHRLPDFESQDIDLDERKDSNPNPRANVAGSAGGNCKIATFCFVAVFF